MVHIKKNLWKKKNIALMETTRVSINGQMDKDVVYGILFSHEKEGNLAVCKNSDKPRGHYAK